MAETREKMNNHTPLVSSEITNCADNILASLFYIELEKCIFQGGTLRVQRKSLVPLGPGRKLEALVVILKKNEARFYIAQTHIPCVGCSSKLHPGAPFCTSLEFLCADVGGVY